MGPTRWQVTGFEALRRWQHAGLGAVSQAEFVPVARECGPISGIGQRVLGEACRQAAGRSQALTVSVSVSVNASLVQAPLQDLCGITRQALQARNLAPQRLQLKNTKPILLQQTRATMQVLHALRALGLRMALDDFGSGYAALGHLPRFPFDTLEIDRSVVRQLLQRQDARASVEMVNGVDSPRTAQVLRLQDCNALRGFLAAKRMLAVATGHILARWVAQPAALTATSSADMPLMADA